MLKILIDSNVLNAETAFAPFGDCHLKPASQITPKTASDYDILIIRSKTHITPQFLDNPRLQFIGSTVSGTEHLNLPLLKQSQVAYACATGCNANSVAEYFLSALLTQITQNHLPIKHNNQTTEQTVGIIGHGNVGQNIEKKVHLLQMQPIIYDPPKYSTDFHQPPSNQSNTTHITQDLKDILNCDHIVLCCALNEQPPFDNHHLINQQTLQHLNSKKPQLLYNLCRGELIDEHALINYCQQHQHLGLIIDCWQNEPHINQQLLDLCLIATPHIAGHSWRGKINGTLVVQQALAKHLGYPTIAPPANSILNKTNIQLDNLQTTTQAIQQICTILWQPINDHLPKLAQKNIDFQQHRDNYPIRPEIADSQLHFSDNILLKPQQDKILSLQHLHQQLQAHAIAPLMKPMQPNN